MSVGNDLRQALVAMDMRKHDTPPSELEAAAARFDALVEQSISGIYVIQDGRFATEWVAESESGRAKYKALQEAGKQHQIEVVGEELRAMMPWISAGKTRVQDASGG